MKKLSSFLIILLSTLTYAQNSIGSFEKYPVFSECSETTIENLENCFNNTIQQFVFENFKSPDIVLKEKYSGSVVVFFEVDKKGNFEILYLDAVYNELKEEARRVFSLLPQVIPARYNGNAAYVQFTMPIVIPPLAPVLISASQDGKEVSILTETVVLDSLANEYDAIEKTAYANDEYKSNINIPLSNHNYSKFDPSLNRVGLNNHTAQKPYVYSEVNKYYNFGQKNNTALMDKKSWFGRKLWNEHMVSLKGEDYWLTLDPGLDLQVGKDFDEDIDTYNNTRLVTTQGGIGEAISFFAVIYESQGRFAGYFNRYAESIKPDGGNPAIIPGQGVAKEFKTDSYDYPVATGHVSYSPSKAFNLQLGHGKLFIGDGYRSLLLSDNASSYPFFKLNTTFWKLKYTNTWMSLRDVRPEVTENGSFRTKYMANHYLSYNITKRLNIGLFESVIWQNDNNRGFDFNYINPIIFYRAIEFSTGSRGGNALIGLTAKYKFTDRMNVYGQLIIDEFSTSDVSGANGSYKNKTGYQLGLKYYDAFGLKNLVIQIEYNRVRPFTYSHNTVVLNYGHNNQSMAHTLGANFSEFIAISRYDCGRIFADAKFILAKRGFEFNTPEDSFYYGGSIYGTEDDRENEYGYKVAGGNTAKFFHMELQGGYVINPATNLKVYGSLIFRDLNPEQNTETVFKSQTSWVNFGIRTDLFNWYNDF
jgi:hypothetical protein